MVVMARAGAPPTAATGGASGRPATLRDVADHLGIALSTVSRALSNPDRVSTATRQRVVEAARALNYVPSQQARALSSGKTGTIALIVPDITNPFFFGIIRGTQRQLHASGYSHVLVDTEESVDLERAALQKLRGSTDGVILSASRLTDSELAGWRDRMPIVAINRQMPGLRSVSIDTASGVAQAVEHLASLGHRGIAYIAGPRHSWSNTLRQKAVNQAAVRLGLSVSVLGPFSPELSSGAAAADAALNARVTACIAFNDLIAIGMLDRLHQRGLSVPGDLSIVGCDDIFGAGFCNPALTTITAPIERAGRAAAALLVAGLDELATPTQGQLLLPTHLTVRASTTEPRQAG
jgi:LacI family transcriptional regulator